MNDRSRPRAWLNGSWLDADKLSVPVTDAGFMQGVTVAEQVRTFRGELFRLDAHLARLARSLDVVGVDPGFSLGELGEQAAALVRHNHRLLSEGDDLGLSIFVTPGAYPAFGAPSGPMVAMHTYRLPFGLWAEKYRSGQTLRTVPIRQVPADCWPVELKCRSRMHYYLADREAAALEPGARAVLLDLEGFVTEASTANVIAVTTAGELLSPPRESILPGISLQVALQLAAELGLPTTHRRMTPADLHAAGEVMLSSTSSCLLPVATLDGRPIGDGQPGPVFQRLIDAWSQHVGLDIVDQADRRKASGRIISTGCDNAD
jgi:branched-subunit amino acid aminotransferase/4-amino-4-deoxychorismate lyase